MSLCDKLKELVNGFHNWVYPKDIEKPECVIELLKALYPSVNWDNVHFHDGLPWFIPASQASAITLPGIWDANQIHIYFNNYNVCDCQGLATVVHEGFHALQYTDIGTTGVGFIRLFMIQYLSCWITSGYENHPMETPAYEQGRNFKACCRELKEKICDCSTSPPSFNQAALDQLLTNCPGLVRKESGHKYNCGFWATIPGFILTLLIGVLLPLVNVIFLFVEALLILVMALGCALNWLWGIIVNLFGQICDWAIELEKVCTEWAATQKKKCSATEDQGYSECAQEEDQGYNECAQEEDQGYNECAQEEDQGYKDCCDWAPCSWFCKAWVWVSNIVCVAWIWIASIICKAFTWVIKKVTCW